MNANRILARKPLGKHQLQRPRRRFEDNTRKDLKKIDCVDKGWLEPAPVPDSGTNIVQH
jgi:hypothetical protein